MAILHDGANGNSELFAAVAAFKQAGTMRATADAVDVYAATVDAAKAIGPSAFFKVFAGFFLGPEHWGVLALLSLSGDPLFLLDFHGLILPPVGPFVKCIIPKLYTFEIICRIIASVNPVFESKTRFLGG